MEHTDLRQLIAQAGEGSLEAVASLVFECYKPYLCGVVRNVYPQADDDAVAEVLHEFYAHIVRPTETGLWRLRGLSAERQPMYYLGRALNNFLADRAKARARVPIINEEFDDSRLAEDSPEFCEYEPEGDDDLKLQAALLALEDCADLKARDRYILYTYLLAQRTDRTPLKLSTHLGALLGLPPSTVYNAYQRALARLAHAANAHLKPEL